MDTGSTQCQAGVEANNPARIDPGTSNCATIPLVIPDIAVEIGPAPTRTGMTGAVVMFATVGLGSGVAFGAASPLPCAMIAPESGVGAGSPIAARSVGVSVGGVGVGVEIGIGVGVGIGVGGNVIGGGVRIGTGIGIGRGCVAACTVTDAVPL